MISLSCISAINEAQKIPTHLSIGKAIDYRNLGLAGRYCGCQCSHDLDWLWDMLLARSVLTLWGIVNTGRGFNKKLLGLLYFPST
jgi:hypothetical protein